MRMKKGKKLKRIYVDGWKKRSKRRILKAERMFNLSYQIIFLECDLKKYAYIIGISHSHTSTCTTIQHILFCFLFDSFFSVFFFFCYGNRIIFYGLLNIESRRKLNVKNGVKVNAQWRCNKKRWTILSLNCKSTVHAVSFRIIIIWLNTFQVNLCLLVVQVLIYI